MNADDRGGPAFRPGESRLPSPPRDPSSDRCPAVHCSLPRLMGCRRLTTMGRPCGRPSWTAVPDGRGFSVGSRGPGRSDRTPAAFGPR